MRAQLEDEPVLKGMEEEEMEGWFREYRDELWAQVPVSPPPLLVPRWAARLGGRGETILPSSFPNMLAQANGGGGSVRHFGARNTLTVLFGFPFMAAVGNMTHPGGMESSRRGPRGTLLRGRRRRGRGRRRRCRTGSGSTTAGCGT